VEKERKNPGPLFGALLALAGTCLSLWLCLRTVERFAQRLTNMVNQTVRETTRMLSPEQAQPTRLHPTAPAVELDPKDELPPWAVGMTEDDLRAGVDPMTGRPLMW
jgi:hypothetical protein